MMWCKHNYIITFAEGTGPIKSQETDCGIRVTTQIKCGCLIYCSKCGKVKKHLSRKIGILYANTKAFEFVKHYLPEQLNDVKIDIGN